MDYSRYQVAPGIWLDARRALWLPDVRTLAVADLHLGYAWAHRHAGQLMPIAVGDDTPGWLQVLIDEYRPEHIVLVGDVVHRAVPVQPLKDEFFAVLNELSAQVRVSIIAGNHDRGLELWLREQTRISLVPHLSAGNCLFVHGDVASTLAAERPIREARRDGRWIVIGHEHPSVTLSDGAATWHKYPCFHICDRIIVLPAFSRWAAGNSNEDFMSPLLECASIDLKVAILGDRLVPLPQG
jgi:uncharacterized protein